MATRPAVPGIGAASTWFTCELAHLGGLLAADPRPLPGINLGLADPLAQRLR